MLFWTTHRLIASRKLPFLILQFQKKQVKKFCKSYGSHKLYSFPEGARQREEVYRHLLFDDSRKTVFCFVEKAGEELSVILAPGGNVREKEFTLVHTYHFVVKPTTGLCVSLDGRYRVVPVPGWQVQDCACPWMAGTGLCVAGTGLCVSLDGRYRVVRVPGWQVQGCACPWMAATGLCVSLDGRYRVVRVPGWQVQDCACPRMAGTGLCLSQDGRYRIVCVPGWQVQDCACPWMAGTGLCMSLDGRYRVVRVPG